MVTYKVINVNSGIIKTRLPDFDYTINPYFGCQFACIYCYAVKYFIIKNIQQKWGDYIEVKGNLPNVIKRELRKVEYGASIGIGVSTDPYQPAEVKYKLTRKVLEIIANREDLEISIQTKSPLVLRDLDILKKIRRMDVGFTIITLNSQLAKVLEPYSPLPQARLRALNILSNSGVETWAFIGPVLPYITDDEDNLREIVRACVGAGVKKIYTDNLRFRLGVRNRIINKLREYFNQNIVEKYRKLSYNELMLRYKRAVRIVEDEAKKLKVNFMDVSHIPFSGAKYKQLM